MLKSPLPSGSPVTLARTATHSDSHSAYQGWRLPDYRPSLHAAYGWPLHRQVSIQRLTMGQPKDRPE